MQAFVYLSIVMLIVSTLFESSILQIKMSGNFQQDRKDWIKSDQVLRQKEEQVEKEGRLLEWVPDEWLSLESSGVGYYEICDKFCSIFATRLRERAHQPDLHWLNLSYFKSFPIIGRDPKHQGVRIYVAEPKGKHSILAVYQAIPGSTPKLIYVIDENTLFNIPTLWHEKLIVEKPLENTLVIYEASTGNKIEEVALKQDHQTLPLYSMKPIVLLRKPIEDKRKIVIPKGKHCWSAEVELDKGLLGRRVAFPLFAKEEGIKEN